MAHKPSDPTLTAAHPFTRLWTKVTQHMGSKMQEKAEAVQVNWEASRTRPWDTVTTLNICART